MTSLSRSVTVPLGAQSPLSAVCNIDSAPPPPAAAPPVSAPPVDVEPAPPVPPVFPPSPVSHPASSRAPISAQEKQARMMSSIGRTRGQATKDLHYPPLARRSQEGNRRKREVGTGESCRSRSPVGGTVAA